jgi:hypothetical protein
MKSTIPLLLAVTIAGESMFELLHEAAVQPHIEPELRVSTPIRIGEAASPGGSNDSEPLGILRQKILYAQRARARRARDPLVMASAFVATARAVMRMRGLKPWECQMQYNCLKWEIELTKRRTRGCNDYSDALPAIAQALGIPDACLSVAG